MSRYMTVQPVLQEELIQVAMDLGPDFWREHCRANGGDPVDPDPAVEFRRNLTYGQTFVASNGREFRDPVVGYVAVIGEAMPNVDGGEPRSST